jgi:hypothetical protein
MKKIDRAIAELERIKWELVRLVDDINKTMDYLERVKKCVK